VIPAKAPEAAPMPQATRGGQKPSAGANPRDGQRLNGPP